MYDTEMQIVLTTFNARYSHTALALRCLRANLGPLREQSEIVEFDTHLPAQTAAERLLERQPRLLIFSVYIWNLEIITETVAIVRALQPQILIVIGGPEVSHEFDALPLFERADHLICGEGEACIEALCGQLLAGRTQPKVIAAPPADLEREALPYEEYTDEDIAHRRIYIETTRGCPFHCDYCLSSLEQGIRKIPLQRLFPLFTHLIERGARVFKLIDRSFNACPDHAAQILQFFLENRREGMMLHLEWEPHLMPAKLEALLRAAPDGFFQLEAGVQTFTPAVAQRIHRQLMQEQVEQHIRLLSELPSVHLHADLIAGLPGETMESLAASFDRLHACHPHEIQLGILKKLRGAPIARHDEEFEMLYSEVPPYDVLQTSTLSFQQLQTIRRFARFWNITVNNGRFPRTAPHIWNRQPSVFFAFLQWTQWLHRETHAVHGFTPGRLGRLLTRFLTEERHIDPQAVRALVESDLTANAPTTRGLERQTRQQRAAQKNG